MPDALGVWRRWSLAFGAGTALLLVLPVLACGF
jgi:hypothetical protein